MTMQIDGEDYEITPAVWEVFKGWYGDKAYRQAGVVADIEAAVRKQIADDIDTRGYELRSSDEGISREEWGCYTEAAEIAREGLASVQSE
jgi:hypothetical protein